MIKQKIQAAGLAQTNIKNCTFNDNNSGDEGNIFIFMHMVLRFVFLIL